MNDGIDGIVFTGGIGENSPYIRGRVMEGMSYLGLHVDPEANAHNEEVISTGPTKAMVVKTDEERVIARAVMSKLIEVDRIKAPAA